MTPEQMPADITEESVAIQKKLEGKEREEFLQKIYTDGFAEFNSWFARNPVSGQRGWGNIGDDRTGERPRGLTQGRASLSGEKVGQLQKEGCNAQFEVIPLTREEIVYENRERIVKGTGWFAKDTVQKYREPVGSKIEPVPLKSFGRKQSDEQAFLVSYKIILRGTKGHFSAEPGGMNRGTKTFDTFIVVPEAEAQEIQTALKNDPTIMKDVIARFNSKLMAFIEANGGLPDATKIFFEEKK